MSLEKGRTQCAHSFEKGRPANMSTMLTWPQRTKSFEGKKTTRQEHINNNLANPTTVSPQDVAAADVDDDAAAEESSSWTHHPSMHAWSARCSRRERDGGRKGLCPGFGWVGLITPFPLTLRGILGARPVNRRARENPILNLHHSTLINPCLSLTREREAPLAIVSLLLVTRSALLCSAPLVRPGLPCPSSSSSCSILTGFLLSR
jgi:hypothetical protein